MCETILNLVSGVWSGVLKACAFVIYIITIIWRNTPKRIIAFINYCDSCIKCVWGVSNVRDFVIHIIKSLYGCLLGKTCVTCYARKRPNTSLGRADRELWDKVNVEMARKHYPDIKVLDDDEMPAGQSAVTFILCPVTSRVGSNVEHALKGITCQKNMVLLLFHPVAPHITFNSNTKEVLFESKHQALGDVVDVVMWSTGGEGLHLYDCPQNSKAVSQICKFIQCPQRAKDI